MSKKITAKQKDITQIHPLFLALIFVQCAITIFVVLQQQTEIDHNALVQRIEVLKATHPQTFCKDTEDAKMSIDK